MGSWRPCLRSIRYSLDYGGCLDRFPDKRRGMNATYGIGDIGMAASVFFMQSPSFLAHQRQLEGHGRSNRASLFGIAKIPPTTTSATCSIRPRRRCCVRCSPKPSSNSGEIDGGLDMFRRLDGRADRAGWQRVSLFAEDPLPALLDAGQRQWRDEIFPQHAGGPRWWHPGTIR